MKFFHDILIPILSLLIVTIILLIILLGQNSINTKNYKDKGQFIDIFKNSAILTKGFIAGASWSDFDSDGDDDLLISGEKVMLYKNVGKDVFIDVTSISKIINRDKTLAGVFGDYNNDSCADLYLSNTYVPPKTGTYESDQLFKNNCDGTFTEVTNEAGIKEYSVGRGVTWIDYNNDSFLDIYVSNHGYFKNENEWISEPDILYRNNKNGRFTNITTEAGLFGYANCKLKYQGNKVGKIRKPSYQPIWFDYNNDGSMDLFATVDGLVSPLYKNNGDGTFTEITEEAGLCKLGSNMGVTVGDYDNDGDLDLYTTNTGANYFWRNNGNGTFSEVAAETKTADIYSIGWGTGFFDYDNDGDLDLYVTNGTVSLKVKPEGFGDEKLDKLYQNNGNGQFSEVSKVNNIEGDYAKYATAFSDYDNNGFVDLIVLYRGDQKDHITKLYKNLGNNNHWLSIKLVGTKSNRDAIGARITVKSGDKSQIREVISGTSYISQNSLTQSFGLGSFSKVDTVEIRWPSGTKQIIQNVKSNQKLVIKETEEPV